MDRRAFISCIAGALVATPLAAEAQQAGKVYRIGYLTLGRSFTEASRNAFYQGLRERGWMEGQNFVLTIKTAHFKSEQLPELVAELVQLKVDVMVVSTAEAALAAKHGTHAIPIVAVDPADAVAIGLVDNLARPGGNVTGFSYLGTELIGKQMQLFKEAIPNVFRVGVLSNPANPTHPGRLREAYAIAQALAVRIDRVMARTPTELDRAFADMAQMRVGGVFVVSDPMFSDERVRVAKLASKSGLPSMYAFRSHVAAGGQPLAYAPLPVKNANPVWTIARIPRPLASASWLRTSLMFQSQLTAQ